MTNVALIFPGQGAQKVGMGKEFYDSCDAAKAVFDSADKILKNDLTSVIFSGPQEKLTLTAYCQPAIVTFSIAALRAFQAHPKYKNIQVKFCAGLSLGEYSALIAGEALGFAEGLRLIERRSKFMEEACGLKKGAMAAVIGFSAEGGSASGGPTEKLIAICKETGAEVANFNSPEQIVISGEADAVATASERIRAAGAKSVIPLDVAGGFHSSLMKPAAEKFKNELQKVSIHAPKIPVISNVTAQPQITPAEISANLFSQITSSVRWCESVQFMASQGITDFIEIGPGRVLKGLLRKIDPALRVHNIEKPQDIESLPF